MSGIVERKDVPIKSLVLTHLIWFRFWKYQVAVLYWPNLSNTLVLMQNLLKAEIVLFLGNWFCSWELELSFKYPMVN